MNLYTYRKYKEPLESYYIDVVKFKERSLIQISKEDGIFNSNAFIFQIGGDHVIYTSLSFGGWVYSISLFSKHYDWEVLVGRESLSEDDSELYTTDDLEKGV